MKQKNNKKKDTGLIFEKYQDLRESLVSDRSISESHYQHNYKEKISELDELFKLRKQELKGASIGFILLGAIFIGLFIFTFITYDSNQQLKWYKHKLEEFMEVTVDSISNYESVHYRSRSGIKLKYNDLCNENDSLDNLVLDLNIRMKRQDNQYQSKIDSLTTELSLLKRYTSSNIQVTKKGSKTTYEVISPKIDSAFILLNYYRDKLIYNKENDTWTVK